MNMAVNGKKLEPSNSSYIYILEICNNRQHTILLRGDCAKTCNGQGWHLFFKKMKGNSAEYAMYERQSVYPVETLTN